MMATIRSVLVSSIVAASLVSFTACTTKVRPYECSALRGATVLDAIQVWDCNRDVMVRVAKGKKFTLEEFRGAAEFFESVTGIPAHAEPTPLGVVPGKGITNNLRLWDDWLAAHRIYLDPEDGRVKEQEGREG